MTNKEKFKEVFEKTFGFVPEDCFPCPETCPALYHDGPCAGCPYDRKYPDQEYKKPEEHHEDDFSFKAAEIMNDLSSTLKEHSPIKTRELYTLICVFMDVVTNDPLLIDDDLGGVRLDMAEMFYKSWPHSVEYYKKGEKKE